MTAPLWQAGATRLAALPARQRRWALFALLVMLLLAAVAAPRGDVPGEPLYAALLSGMRYASGFYDGLADLLRADPAARPLGLFPPALAIVDSSLPGWATMLLLAAALTGWLWIGMLRLVPLFARGGAQALAIALLALGAVAGALLWTDAPHAGWAALLVALAVLVRRADRWVGAAALGALAAMVDPAAILATAILALLALVDGWRREAAGWAAAAALALAVLGAHLFALGRLGLPPSQELATMPADGAARLIAAALPGVPAALAAPLLLLAALGWGTLSRPLGLRVLAILAAGVACDGLFGAGTATLAALLVAPGLALAPDAVADLYRGALDRRRFTVTRFPR